jgi:hypothetical protein
MAVAPLAPGIEPLARALLLALATEHRRIQVQREPRLGTLDQAEQPAPERPPEALDVGPGEAPEEVADGVIAGEALQPEEGVRDAVGAQPLAVGEALGPDHDGHEERREGVSQGDGVVGSRRRKGQAALHLLGEADGAEEGDEAGQPAEGRDGPGSFVQNQLGGAKEGGNWGAGRFVRGRAGLFKHPAQCPQPLSHGDPFSIPEFGYNTRSQ